ncbi:hypothetical protein [Agrobacterium rosae]|uniref:RDD family protein n=1 Tax=Agrobacterium rosae TaxID=1972867 RepID=A0A1R3U101_9HYPH|nr:hypothetical protein [Agrobacterium rosae]SCX34671.1 hypothetical protein DSM25559_4551 [Agrobacterium rosae]
MSTTETRQVSTWRIVLAFILDFLTSFMVFGYIIATLFGGTTDGGFKLEGGPALLLFAAVIAYFIVFNRFLGGTIWKHILKAKR